MTNFLSLTTQNSNNPTASQGPATSESNNLPIGRATSGSGLGKRKCYGGLKDVHLMEQTVLVKSESTTAAAAKVDMELLAKNRGNAMQRYKEKKKTRRCFHPPCFLFLTCFFSGSSICQENRNSFAFSRVYVLLDMISTSGMNQGKQELILESELKVGLLRLVMLQMDNFILNDLLRLSTSFGVCIKPCSPIK